MDNLELSVPSPTPRTRGGSRVICQLVACSPRGLFSSWLVVLVACPPRGLSSSWLVVLVAFSLVVPVKSMARDVGLVLAQDVTHLSHSLRSLMALQIGFCSVLRHSSWLDILSRGSHLLSAQSLTNASVACAGPNITRDTSSPARQTG